jgi:type IX secretion system substrate protein
LYAAGSFMKADDGTAVDYIAEIQSGGLWTPLNSGLNEPAFVLAVSGDSLYVGGDFTEADGQVDSALAVWNNTSQEWNPIAASGCDGTVYALAADGKGGVYAGGDFSEVAQVNRGNLVHWDGSAFGTVASGVNNTVEALATDSGALYAGGWFTEAGSSSNISLHFGALDGDGVDAVSAPISANNPTESIYPNPVINAATVDISLAQSGPIKLELFNSIGERVSLLADGPFAQGKQSFSLNSKGLPDGLYFLRLTVGGVISTQSVAIEK